MVLHLRPEYPRRATFLEIPLDLYTMEDAVGLASNAMRRRERLQHGDVNVAKLIGMRTDAELLRCTAQSDIICVDGMGIVWGCRLMGLPVKERVSGIDMMMRVLAVCAREGFRPYFLGGREEVVQRAVEEVRRQHPRIQFAGWRNGYFRPEDESAIVAEIAASQADCLFVGISSPIKERFLNTHRNALDVPVQMGVGGSFDVLAGRVKRAPVWMQSAGLEWLYRFAQEPRRMAGRYLSSNIQYAVLLGSLLAHRQLSKVFRWSRS